MSRQEKGSKGHDWRESKRAEDIAKQGSDTPVYDELVKKMRRESDSSPE